MRKHELPQTKTNPIELTFEPLELKLANPFGISRGTTTLAQNLLVRLKYGSLIGFGEAAPSRTNGETVQTVQAVLTAVRDKEMLGDDPTAMRSVMMKIDRFISGHPSAKAALDMAFYDLLAKIAGLPLYKYLGLAGLPLPLVDMTIGIDNLDTIERKAKEALAAGHKILKVKLGTDYDREIVRKIRDIDRKVSLQVDANGAWTVKQTMQMIDWLCDYDVDLIEQPLPKNAAVDDFCLIRDYSPIPIFADESILQAEDAVRFEGAVDGVVVKLMKTGGIYEALRLIHTAKSLGQKVMLGCMVESSLAITAACHLAPLADYSDLDGALLLSDDPFEGAYLEEGYLKLPDRSGLGVLSKS
jgi:L-Ala-D/L-Glu epimerase